MPSWGPDLVNKLISISIKSVSCTADDIYTTIVRIPEKSIYTTILQIDNA